MGRGAPVPAYASMPMPNGMGNNNNTGRAPGPGSFGGSSVAGGSASAYGHVQARAYAHPYAPGPGAGFVGPKRAFTLPNPHDPSRVFNIRDAEEMMMRSKSQLRSIVLGPVVCKVGPFYLLILVFGLGKASCLRGGRWGCEVLSRLTDRLSEFFVPWFFSCTLMDGDDV